MSRFFDKTRSAQILGAKAGTATHPEAETWMDDLHKPSVIGAEIAELRLAHCRKTRLTLPADAPLMANSLVAKDGAVESYRLLRTRLMRIQVSQGLHSIIMSSTVSNEGKTLTTLNLAQAYASLKDQRVLVVDGDLRTSGLSRFFTPCSGPGLADALAGDANFADVIQATDNPNLYVVSTGQRSASPPELYASPRWKEFLGWCSECFKLILVDTPPIFPLSDFDLMASACDGIVLVVRAQRTQREVLQKAAAQIDPKKLLGIVYNATQSEHRKSKYYNPYFGGDTN